MTLADTGKDEATMVVESRVNRDGRVLAREIVRSSVHPELDKEIISMIERCPAAAAISTQHARRPARIDGSDSIFAALTGVQQAAKG